MTASMGDTSDAGNLGEPSDRTVHADHPERGQVVRYDRAGRWYLEPPSGQRTALTLGKAVHVALDFESDRGHVYLNRPGGMRFDAKIRASRLDVNV